MSSKKRVESPAVVAFCFICWTGILVLVCWFIWATFRSIHEDSFPAVLQEKKVEARR